MAFAFRQVTVSGHRVDTEGTSQAINEITDVMVNEMGWVLEEDRRSQAGSTNVTLTHKVVFKSDGGETGDQPNWYFTLTSGTSSTTGRDELGFQMCTAYNTATHDTNASGVETPPSHTTLQLYTDSDGPGSLWISGDKDGVVLVTKVRGTKSFMAVGRAKHFLDDTLEPYGLYCYTAINSFIPTSVSVRGIVGEPPVAIANANEGEVLAYALAATNEPRVGLGNSESVWTAMPMVFTSDDASPSRKGAIGICSNHWSATNWLTGIDEPTEFVVSGTEERYLAFGNTTSLVIRKS